ncbi:MAG: carbonic anhydrase [Magnetococcales bacterium]|nr:carbonic anhydrase [Magnetococcales bacterium]NGZ26136.1 carbonic anhydrase [Magnetococcales bacterium]
MLNHHNHHANHPHNRRRTIAGPGHMSPDEALARLKEGHARFLAGKSVHPHVSRERLLETATKGQHPFASFISCSDSRVPVEIIFDQGIGDLFVVRVAGNIIDMDEIGSTEYSEEHLGISLLVVMGHSQCGAVSAVVQHAEVGGAVAKLVQHITPALERASSLGLTGDALLAKTIEENVRHSIAILLEASPETAEMVHEGKVKIIGAIYHIEDGHITWLE